MTDHRFVWRVSTLLTIAFLGSSTATAQLFEFCDDFTKSVCCQRDPYEERIETERHDFTQSAVTVGRGVLQFEGGYTYFYKDTGHEIEGSHSTPELMVRYGISEDIEIRLRTNYAWQFIDEEPNQEGAEDLRYSIKLQLNRQCEGSIRPTSALEIRGSAPTGGNDFSTDRAEFSLDHIYQWECSDGITFAGSTGFGTNGFADFGLLPVNASADRFVALSQSAVLGCELSEQNTLYAEWFGIFSQGLADEFVVSIFNIGVDHYVSDNIVVDIRFGKGLSSDSDDFFCGVGGGVRY